MWLGCLPFAKCTQTVCVDQQFAFTKNTREFHKVRGENEDLWAGRGLLFRTPHPGAGGWSPGTCLMGFLSPWLSLLWELRVWQMGLVFHDNAASMVWVPFGDLVQRGLHAGLSGFRIWNSVLQFGGEMGSQENDENVLTDTCGCTEMVWEGIGQWGGGGFGGRGGGCSGASGGLSAPLKTSKVLWGWRGSVSASGQGKTD